MFQELCIALREPLSEPQKVVVGNKRDNRCKIPDTWEAHGSINGSSYWYSPDGSKSRESEWVGKVNLNTDDSKDSQVPKVPFESES